MALLPPEELVRRAQGIRLAAFDVDGVMTNGALTFDSEGRECKTFHVRDGLGLKLLQQGGITLAIITGRNSPIVDARARELGIRHVIQSSQDKRAACQSLLEQLGLDWSACAYMGDDLPDLPVLRRCALAMTVPEAPEAIRAQAHWIAPLGGGEGAVRSAAEMILGARGQWQDLLQAWQS
ncbi:MAG: HAD hydrolase family protein [Betaproteobacteria bacterium]|nr:HAD hydrolase family protein [Betaproteobacteria bacterium]MDE2211314.1 HAD hydrolase family protein [Betaproteobacteria bacterium]